jgi:hypothetical protein
MATRFETRARSTPQLAAGNAQLAAEAHEEREAMIGFDD